MAHKKILYDARGITPKPCGVRNVAENYLRELTGRYDIVALVNANTAHLIDAGLNRETAPRWASRFSLLSDFWISFQVMKHRPDIFFSAHSFLPPFAMLPRCRAFICHDLFASLDKSFFRKRGLLAPLARAFFRFLSEVSFWRASLVISPSAAIADSFKKLWISPRRVIVIHNGISIPSSGHSVTARDKRILYVGNFRPYKGFDTLFEAWKVMAASPDANEWQLDIVTNEPQTSIQRFIEEHGRPDRMNFHSRIDDARLEKLRQGAKIAVVPSRDEGFGIPLLEAVAAGGFVIYSDIPVFREIVTSLAPEMMMSFPAGNAGKLVETITAALHRAEENLTAAGINRTRIHDVFSWKTSADRLIAELG